VAANVDAIGGGMKGVSQNLPGVYIVCKILSQWQFEEDYKKFDNLPERHLKCAVCLCFAGLKLQKS
jgi:hypothetical protein